MNKQNLEGIYPLGPMQEALLFGNLAPGAVDAGFLQVRFVLRGALDVAVFERAWQQVVERHEALRTSVQSRDEQRPLLVVWRTVDVPWVYEDWQEFDAMEQKRRFAAFCEEDRRRGLDLSKAPVTRFTLIRTAATEYQFAWSCHHILLDGWSSALVLQDVFSFYQAIQKGEEASLPAITSLRDYLAWLKRQDPAKSETFWRENLRGFQSPAPLTTIPSGNSEVTSNPRFEERVVLLDAELSTALHQVPSSLKVTPNALVQGAWALLMSAWSASNDVVFGATVSGRSAGLPGVERFVGFLSNVLPIRVKIDPSVPLRRWLTTLRDSQFSLQAYEHVSLIEIQSWTEEWAGHQLFDTLLVLENFPWKDLRCEGNGGLELRQYEAGVTTTHPLTIVVSPGEEWSVCCIFNPAQITDATVSGLLQDFPMLLRKMCEDPEQPIADLLRGLESTMQPPQRVVESSSMNVTDELSHVPPRDEIELQLTRIWEETLGVRPIGVRDNFFELGGRSLVAVRMFAKVEDRFRKRLPLAMLWEHPTIEQLARSLQNDQPSRRWSSLVPIQSKGTKTPLFFVHAGGVHALFYGDLARHLGPEQPVYALQPVGLDGTRPPMTRLEDLAAHYLEELRCVQPTGPYLLVGHCLGGPAGFEMAQQLVAQGERVALLAILDTEPPEFDERPGSKTLSARLSRATGRMQRRDWHALRRSLATVGSRVTQGLRRRWVHAWGSAESRRLLYRQKVHEACREAFAMYFARPYPGKLTLIRSTQSLDVHLNWTKIASSFECFEVPVGHLTMFQEPDVEHLSRALAQCVDAAVESEVTSR